jgi:amino acid permease
LQLFSAKFWDNQQDMTKEEEKKIKRLMVVVIFLGILMFAMLGLVIYGVMQKLSAL